MSNCLVGTNGVGVKGYVQLEVVNPKTGVRRIVKSNTVVNAGKKFMQADGANDIIRDMCLNTQGRLVNNDVFGYVSASSSNVYRYIPPALEGFNCSLLSLGDGVELTAETQYVPVRDETTGGISTSKVLGYANRARTAEGTREGIVDNANKDHLIDKKAIANRWKFAEGVATGEFDHIAFGPGFTDRPNGVYTAMNIARCAIDADAVMEGGYFIPPGMGDVTANSEIAYLVKGIDGTAKYYKYSLDSGETTELASDSKAYGVLSFLKTNDLNVVAAEYVNGVLFILTNGGALYKFNVSTSTVTGSVLYTGIFSIWKEGTTLCTIYSTSGTREDASYHYLMKFDVVSYDSVTRTTQEDLSVTTDIGGLPTWMNMAFILVFKADGKYFVGEYYDYVDTTTKGYGIYKKGGFVVCTDLTNIAGTIVGEVNIGYSAYDYRPGAVPYASSAGLVFIGEQSPEYGHGPMYTNMNVGGVANNYYNTKYRGVYVSLGWWANVCSFVKLSTPINKTADDIVYVSYGYVFD